jgi:hypothetical protein
MQERGAREADLDERRLHAGQHARDAALVEVADDAAAARALDVHLLQHAVLEQRGARLARRDVDEDLDAHAAPPQSGRPAPRSSSAVSASGNPTTPE